MTEPLLSVRDLRVQFPTRRGVLTAVDGVSFDIHPGEILGVVGESGAGKSQTGAAIIGLLEPPGRIAGGRIILEGQRIDGLTQEQLRKVRGRKIGAVFQDPLTSLNPLYTVGRQLTETIRTHLDMSERAARARALELLQEVGIPGAADRLDAYPHQFSGGMRQRVVIALALCANPRLIIADEPTTALDVSIQAQITSLLKRLCREHDTAVMLITHDMGVIAETADRVAVLYGGRLAEVGPVDDVVNRPLHPYTEGLMACIPTTHDRPPRLAQIEGSMPSLTAMPDGCAFHPRCPHAHDRCVAERPPLFDHAPSSAACWLWSSEGTRTLERTRA
ncbi:ABC transporter ATP-binding protein [Roseospira navarrensis]|uniref:ATP-binding cassette domain-containing protein n=1 Tax=Roseospira navarrensis TaxID=140058 RepID=A0A7X1ZEL3_9PROT|nr:ABC transporter ATP-binding protein [Roseospira navarrensis]MQX37153.1 ATP-binding cassette domain-containing protein [Roseospira navarrensis]